MLNIIVAPNSINRNGEKITKRVVRFLKNEKVDFSVYFSSTINEVSSHTLQLIDAGETDYVIIGGDAIISEFINSVKDLSKIKLGIIPTNKSDDLASYLNLEHNPISAIRMIIQGNIERIDVLLMNDKRVVNNILIGASTVLEEIVSQYKVQNGITRNYALLKYGSKFDGIDLKIESKNQKIITDNIFELSISNGGKSNGRQVSPLANMHDGLFNFNYVSTPQREHKKRYLRLFKRGNQIYDDQTKQSWLNNIKITNPDNKIKAVVDGKVMTVDSMNISILEKVLKIYKTN